MEKRENEKLPEETWHLPVRPIDVPPDVKAALVRAERDAFLARHAPGDRQLPSILTGRGDESFGR
jgi:hypothetical protein